MTQDYTQEKFESDMRELGLLMDDKNQNGGNFDNDGQTEEQYAYSYPL